MFSKYSTSGKGNYKGSLCVAGKWAGNKIAPDPTELGMAGGVKGDGRIQTRGLGEDIENIVV